MGRDKIAEAAERKFKRGTDSVDLETPDVDMGMLQRNFGRSASMGADIGRKDNNYQSMSAQSQSNIQRDNQTDIQNGRQPNMGMGGLNLRNALNIPTQQQRQDMRESYEMDTNNTEYGYDEDGNAIQKGHVHRNNPADEQGKKPGFLSNHGDAVIAGIIGLMAGKVLAGTKIGDMLGLPNNNNQQNQDNTNTGASGKGNKKTGFGIFGTLITIFTCIFMMGLAVVVGGMILNMYNAKTTDNMLDVAVSTITGVKLDGSEYVADKRTMELTEDLLKREIKELEYTKVDDETVSVQVTDYNIVNIKMKSKKKKGKIKVEVVTDTRDNSLFDYRVIE